MAVFTSVTADEVGAWLRPLRIGPLTELVGIASGIENTNYYVMTGADRAAGKIAGHATDSDDGRYVLTIFEKLSSAELPFYLGLMGHLARAGVRCPKPIAAGDGRLFRPLKGKPAALVTRLAGRAVMQPRAIHCAAVGATLACMHRAGADYVPTRDNPRGPKWWHDTAPAVLPFLDADRRALLSAELAYQAQFLHHDLPRGPVHADLFRDNVLFDGDELGGVIDFYFAGVDAWLYDLAVTLNDWCIDHASGVIDTSRARALLDAYAQVRSIMPAERAAWPVMLRAGALRFWLSRLYDFYLPRPGELIHAHDPEHFCRILKLRVAASATPPAL